MVYGFELVTSFDWATDSDGYYNFTLPDKDQEHGLREGVSFVLFAAINQAHWLKTSNIRGSYRLFFQTRTQISSRASVKLHTNTPETRLSLGDLANSFAKMAANYLCDDHEPLYIGEGIVHRAMCSLELPDKRGPMLLASNGTASKAAAILARNLGLSRRKSHILMWQSSTRMVQARVPGMRPSPSRTYG
jgi:hypothetical protein